MHKVKVKTLNNEDQLFDFEDHMTVLNLKEKIFERLNISPENQRLIYCGRILQNDKKLEEYDLNNKVIHLVDSPPNLDNNTNNNGQNVNQASTTTSQSTATNQSSSNSTSQQDNNSNSEVTGSTSHFSININLNGANVHSNAQSRVSTLTRILDYINRAIDKLEDPNQSPVHEQSFESLSTLHNGLTTNSNASGGSRSGGGVNSTNNTSSSSTIPVGTTSQITEIGILALGDPNSGEPNNFLDQLNAGLQGSLFDSNDPNSMIVDITNLTAGPTSTTLTSSATSSSTAAGVAATTTNSATNTTDNNATNNNTLSNNSAQQSQQNGMMSLIGNLTRNLISQSIGQSIGQSINYFPFTSSQQVTINNNNSTTDDNNRTRSTTNDSSTTNTNNNQQSQQQQNSTQSNVNHRVTWAQYAELLDSVRQTQERFNPHFNSFQQSLLQRHGSLNQQQAEEEQTKYRLIARCMHHLAHVYHLLSDFYVNYVHQQDQTIQVFEPLNVATPPRRPPINELRRGNGISAIFVGPGSLTNLSNLNTNASNQRSSSSNNSSNANDTESTNNIGLVTSSLPRDFMYPTRTEQSQANNGSNIPPPSSMTGSTANNSNNSSRNNIPSSFLGLPNFPTANNTNQSATNNSRNIQPDARDPRSVDQGFFQRLFSGPSPSNPNVIIASSSTPNVVIASSSARSAPMNIPGSSTSISIIQQSVGIPIAPTTRNFVSGNLPQQPTQQQSTQQQPTQQQSQQPLNDYVRSTFHNLLSQRNPLNTTSTTRSTSQQQQSTTTSTTNSYQNSSSNQIPSASISNQRMRMPQSSFGAFPNNYVYNHVRNFDPHLPCTSNWLIPEVRGRLEVEMNLNIDTNFVDLAGLGRQQTSSNSNQQQNNSSPLNNNNSSSRSNETSSSSSLPAREGQSSDSVRSSLRSRIQTRLQSQPQQNSNNTSGDEFDAQELFNEINRLFSSYLEEKELLKRIDNLPSYANNSLSSFMNSMNILNLVSKDQTNKSPSNNITFSIAQLFTILAQKISVIEFLKIIFSQDFKCLNRAMPDLINYARTNLLFSTEQPFDISSCVDDLLKIWKQVLISSFNELEFSERTFSALMSELRANLSVFLRTFTRTFDDNTENSNFASTVYFAIHRLFLDFHTSISQMFRSPNNVMRAYRNILIHIFPNPSVRNIIVAILSYQIPAIDETERTTLEPTRFRERVLRLSDQKINASLNDNGTTLLANNQTTSISNSSNSAASSSSSSSSDYQTPMEVDINFDYEPTYGTERWHFDVPKNWVKTLKKDRSKILGQPVIRRRLQFSSMYKDAYKKNQ